MSDRDSTVRRSLVAVALLLSPRFLAAGVVRIVPNDAGRAPCIARAVSVAGGTEAAGPCNAPLKLAPGTYDAWLEAENRITPFPTNISVRGQGEEGFDLPPPRSPAGRVAVAVSTAHRTVEIVHLQAHHDETRLQRLFQRRATARGAEPLQFPEGPAFGVARNDAGAAVAVSRPFFVRTAVTNNVVLAPPESDRAVLVIELTLPAGSQDGLSLTAGESQPDAMVVAVDRLLAVWYDRPPGSVPLRLDSKTHYWLPQIVNLSGGRISWIEGELRDRPSLHVTVTAPDPVAIHDEMRLRIEASDSTDAIETAVTLGHNEIVHVPVSALDVSLTMGKWQFRERVDTSQGADATVLFELRPAVVKGVVTYGDQPVRAEVAFTSNAKHAVRTDDQGAFQITLWTLRRYGLAVTLPDHPQVPMFTDTFRISGDRELHIRIPRAAWRLGIVDAKSREKIGHATVFLKNAWEDDVEGQRSTSLRVETDDRGETLLPPLRKGTVELRGEAGGYLTSEPVTRVVLGDAEEVFVPIALDSADEPPLQILLEDGQPASGAAAAGLVADRIVWTAMADARGFVSVPPDFEGPIAVRHPTAASGVRGWTRGETAAQWKLQHPAPPLRLRVVDHAQQPVPSAAIGAWFGDFRVTGTALSFLLRAPGVTMGDGSWVGTNLPPGPFRIVAMEAHDPGGLTAGTYDAFFITIPYPWPGNQQLKIMD
jgi:hypothetical protein